MLIRPALILVCFIVFFGGLGYFLKIDALREESLGRIFFRKPKYIIKYIVVPFIIIAALLSILII